MRCFPRMSHSTRESSARHERWKEKYIVHLDFLLAEVCANCFLVFLLVLCPGVLQTTTYRLYKSKQLLPLLRRFDTMQAHSL